MIYFSNLGDLPALRIANLGHGEWLKTKIAYISKDFPGQFIEDVISGEGMENFLRQANVLALIV